MIERIEPFHRLPAVPGWLRWTMRLMRVHFTLAGVLFLAGAAALLAYLYTLELGRISLGSGLRIARPGSIYERDMQIRVAGAAVLGVLSLLQFQAVARLGQRRRSGPALIRLAALILLAGLPAGVILGWRASSAAQDGGVIEQFLADLSLGVYGVAVLLIGQAVLALWYMLCSFTRALRALCARDVPAIMLPVRRVRRAAIGLWAAVAVGLGLWLAVLTDWLYELPVPRPQPGELLYATTFDAFNDEWDIYPGRDSAQVVQADDSGSAWAADSPAPGLVGNMLVVRYGSGAPGEVVWSTLDRKFGDMDLRVTAWLLDGPIDQNQFGVVFRYRDPDDFYVFRISADGYYSLARVSHGVEEKISDWGVSAAIRQGKGVPNEIRIVAQDDAFRFFVNGQPMPLCLKGANKTSMWAGPGVCYTDELRPVFQDRAFRQGRVALAAGTIDGSEVAVAFDDLLIVGPDPAVMVAGAED